MNIRIISAGAGSGKTFRLTAEMVKMLESGVRPSGIIATTFTKKAAAELQERVRIKLLEGGMHAEAEELTNALIGTVHGLGVKLLQRFAYEAGVSPDVGIMADEDHQTMFNQSIAMVLSPERVQLMEDLCDKLGLHKRGHYDWRKEVRQLAEIARINNFSEETLDLSREKSIVSFAAFLEDADDRSPEDWTNQLSGTIETTIIALSENEDSTKKTGDLIRDLKQFKDQIELRGFLYWHQWLKLAKASPGAKSRADYSRLQTLAKSHLQNPGFHADIASYIHQVFELAKASIREFEQYKKSRGLIDYTDMEVLVNQLLDSEQIKNILKEEIDLLMVDEFQDTSPIQLEIFIKLSKLAGQSIWVGDPKQSIYGFRGAEPALMQAVIKESGGVKPEDIQDYSWRSREDIVYAVNNLFTKAFTEIPPDQIALKPKRTKIANENSINQENEPIDIEDAIIHWHFETESGQKRSPKRPWFENCLAESVKALLANKPKILPKGENRYRSLIPGDIAILCRTNKECQVMAESLKRAGIKTAIAGKGLLQTAEAKLVLACLRYLLNSSDSLSIAEILVLAADQPIEYLVEHRLNYLRSKALENSYVGWAAEEDYIAQLNAIRPKTHEMTSAEIINLILEELHLRYLIVSWGNAVERLDNIEALRNLAIQYEENCERLHLAASLGGFLLWLNRLSKEEKDPKGFGQNENAVNVLTYHRSKGLEWPVVICHSLEGKLRSNTFGFTIVNEATSVDLNNILGNRWLRYWINPYGDRIIMNSDLENRMKESTYFLDAQKEALGEEARLMYVGLTRARDHLIFPAREVPTRWLNRIWHNGDEDIPTLDKDQFETPWSWEGNIINKQTELFVNGNDFTFRETEEGAVDFLAPASGKLEYATKEIDLRKEKQFIPELQVQCLAPKPYAPVWQLPFDVVPYQLAKALKAFLIADQANDGAVQRSEMAERLIKGYDLGEFVAKHDFVRQSDQWQQLLFREFNPQRIHKKQSLRYPIQGRYFNTVVDLVLETEEGLALIQNSSFAGDSVKKQGKKAQDLGSWFYLCQLALKEHFQPSKVRCLVHYVLSGTLVEVELSLKPKAEKVEHL